MWSSHATKRPVAYKNLHARTKRRAALIHTNDGGTNHGSLFDWWTAGARGDRGQANLHVGAHFQVMNSGHAEQYVDTDLVVYHAYSASEWAVGFEVEDDGDPSRPMTAPQLATIESILRELRVPGKVLASDQPADGVGWHEQFHAWNQSGHHCPGPVREAQVRSGIIPALQAPPLTVPWWWHRTLRPGSVGADVVSCKRRMTQLGYGGISQSPSFGPALENAVKVLQTRNHMAATGIVDRPTAHVIRVTR